jgi:hypothetical protein
MALFVLLLGAWLLAAWQMTPAGAEPLSLGFALRSRLSADYSADTDTERFSVLRLTVFEEWLGDLGLSPTEAATALESLEVAMANPVPSATARIVPSPPPNTPTSVPTGTVPSVPSTALGAGPAGPTETAILGSETPQASESPQSPTPVTEATATATLEASPTPSALPASPTASPPPPSPTSGAPPAQDTQPPFIQGWDDVDPDSGDRIGCVQRIEVDDLVVVDDRPSQGIASAYLKYSIEGSSCTLRSWNLHRTHTRVNCDGGSCRYENTYDGSLWVNLSAYAQHCELPPPGGSYDVTVWAVAVDRVGLQSETILASYSMWQSCNP